MTKPRERHPNTLWAVTRRTHNGEFRLRPDDEVTNAIGYIVAIACWRYAIDLVTFVAMSNHYHATLSDRYGRIADWECYVNSRLAKYLNARHKRGSHVFDASEGNALEVEGQAFIEKSVYTLANPTKAGLVHSPTSWPGLYIGLRDLRRGTRRTFYRPPDYFDESGPLPDEIDLVAKTPPGWEPKAFCDELEGELRAEIVRHRATIEAAGRSWLRAAGVLATSPFAMPKRPLPANVGHAAKPRPRLIGGTPAGTKAMIARYKAFLERYAAALAAVRDGVVDVLFPEGTWRLWRSFGARRGEPGTPGERWVRPPAPAWPAPAAAPS